MHKYKMLIVYNSPLNLENGSNTHILELINNLTKYIDLLVLNPKSETNTTCEFSKEINNPLNKKVNSIIYQLIYQINLFKELMLQCTKNKPDIIYERLCGWSFFPALIAKLFNIPYFVEINGLMVDELKIENYPSIYIKICILNEKRSYHLSKKIITVTPGIKDSLINLYGLSAEKIIVVNNGANIQLFKPMDTIEVRNILKLDPSFNYICFVGNLAPWQGIEYLIEASPLILEKQPNTIFLVVGDGVMKDKLLTLVDELNIAEKFIFTGTVPYEKVPFYINASDICVAPFVKARNAKIGLSALKTYEYLACGKPVVVSDIPGQIELVSLSEGGLIFAAENSRELADSINKLLLDSSLRFKMGINGHAYVVVNHSWNSVAKKIINICKEVMKEESR